MAARLKKEQQQASRGGVQRRNGHAAVLVQPADTPSAQGLSMIGAVDGASSNAGVFRSKREGAGAIAGDRSASKHGRLKLLP